MPVRADINLDEITVYMPRFESDGALGQNAATVLNLQLWSTMRRMPWPNNPEKLDFGPARIVWDSATLSDFSHDAAQARARAIDLLAQIVLWGRAYLYGEGIVIQLNMTLPKYADFRQRNFEVWNVKLGNRSLSVDVPRRRFDLSSIVLAPEFINSYSTPNALALYDSPRGGKQIGTIGAKFTAIEFNIDVAKVISGGKIGWVRLPQLSHHSSEAVDMAAAIIRIFRGDWKGAIARLDRVLASPVTKARLRVDAYLYRAMALEQLDRSGRSDIEHAYALSPYSQAVVQYMVMSDLAQLARSSVDATTLRARIRNTIDEHRYLFPPMIRGCNNSRA